MSLEKVSKKKTLADRWAMIENAIYSVGAAIVIIGALFKLTHKPGAEIMLSVGLITEAVIFVISAFQKPHKMPDWKKVYRELNEDYDAERDGKTFEGIGSGVVSGTASIDVSVPELSSDVMERLRTSVESLANTAESMKDISDAAAASSRFAQNMNNASDGIEEIAKSSQSAVENISKIGETQSQFVESMESSLSNIQSGAKAYSQNLESVNASLSSLQSVYEEQTTSSNTIQAKYASYTQKLDEAQKALDSNVENVQALNEPTVQLRENIKELNNVYGKMLNAFDMKK